MEEQWVGDTVPVKETVAEAVTEDGKGKHRGPRITPAIPKLGPNPVMLLS